MVAVGVTGHRVLTDAIRVAEGVDRALRHIREVFPGRPLTVLSSLAEGADRLVARRVLSLPGSRLVVPLPMPAEEYVLNFGSEESRSEFAQLLDRADRVVTMPETYSPEEAYEAAGVYVVENSDVLLAIWDGRTGRGRGGTADVVARAEQRGMPTAWVRTGDPHDGGGKSTAGDVSYRNL